MSLQDLQGRWLEKWDEMHELSSSKVAIAAPFMSVGPCPQDRRLHRTILMVGKATHGDWCMGPFEEARAHPESERIQERMCATKAFLKERAPTRRGGFWGFYRELSNFFDDADIIWTNAAKIGVWLPKAQKRSVNPFGTFLELQKDLAAETLAAEVLEYAPDLVLCLTSYDTVDKVVCLAFRPDEEWEEKSLAAGKPVWIRRRSTNHPPVLCTGHPGFKGLDLRRAWLTEASRLMS